MTAPAATSGSGAAPAAAPMFELRGVTKRFDDFVAVDGVDLVIQAGEFLTLLGPSGCGKTTLLRLLAGFETPSTGRVFLGGEDVTDVPPYRRDVNQVFQSYALFPHLTVAENIAFGLRMRRLPKTERGERVREAMAMVSLEGLEGRRPSQLSGGQRQRVALARALVCRPKALLLDEPLSALDAKLRHAMQLELKHLQRRLGLTFVFVTHDQEEALTMSDRIAVVHRGRIEQIGEATEIYHEPRTPFAADFIGQANLLRAEVVSRNGALGRVRLEGGLELTVRAMRLPDTGRPALLSIRPEKIHLAAAPIAEGNAFAATIEEEIFRGALDQLQLRLHGGLALQAIVANESAHERSWHRGDRIWCSLHPDDIVVVSAPDEPR